MLKASGAFLLMAAAILFGLQKKRALYSRLKLLRESESATLTAEVRLRCMRMTLDDCFRDCGAIFSAAAQKMQHGMLPCDALTTTVHETEFLRDGDKSIFLEYAQGLSCGDCEGQLSNLKMLSTRLQPLVCDAAAEAQKQGKLWLEGCVLAGAAAVLMML